MRASYSAVFFMALLAAPPAWSATPTNNSGSFDSMSATFSPGWYLDSRVFAPVLSSGPGSLPWLGLPAWHVTSADLTEALLYTADRWELGLLGNLGTKAGGPAIFGDGGSIWGRLGLPSPAGLPLALLAGGGVPGVGQAAIAGVGLALSPSLAGQQVDVDLEVGAAQGQSPWGEASAYVSHPLGWGLALNGELEYDVNLPTDAAIERVGLGKTLTDHVEIDAALQISEPPDVIGGITGSVASLGSTCTF